MGKKVIQSLDNDLKGYGAIKGEYDDLSSQLAEIMKQSISSEPTIGTWELGDKVWNSSPVAGGNLGWICVQEGTFGAGTPPVFKQFGIISA